MESFSFLSVLCGVGAAIGVSAIAGLTMGAAMTSDIQKDLEQEDPALSDEALEAKTDSRLMQDLATPGPIAQMVALSLIAAAIGGAVTSLIAGHAALINGMATGGVICALNLFPAPLIKAPIRMISAALSLPATLLGAWAMGAV